MIRQRLKFYLAAGVSVIAFIVYLSALQNEFIQWDDDLYVYENLHIRILDAAFFRWAFFDFHAGNWHPLTWISHALDYAIWGLNPLGHHLTNVILHALNTFVVVVLGVRLLEIGNSPSSPLNLRGEQRGGKIRGERWGIIQKLDNHKISPDPSRSESMRRVAPTLPKRGSILSPPLEKGDRGGFSDKELLIAAVTTGLLFGLHPLHVESVAWVSERKDLLCALFFLLSVMMYVRYAGSQESEGYTGDEGNPPSSPLKLRGERPSALPLKLRGGRGSYDLAFSLIFFILALLSKPMAVTLPVVLLILDWYPFERIRTFQRFRSACVEKLPFIALSLGSSLLTVLAQRAGGAVKSMVFAPLSTRVLVAVKSLIVYLLKMVLPLNLVPFYPYPKDASLLSIEYLAAIALVAGITAACIIMARRQRIWLSVWGYYVIMLLPVLGIVQVGLQSMADRYTYLPGLGPFLLLGVMAAGVWARIERLERGNSIAKFLAVWVSVSLIVSLSYLTFKQIGIWKNSIVFWSYVIEKEPERVLSAYINRGVAFEKTGQINRAIADYDKAITIDPLNFEAYNNRGVLYGQAGMFDKATEYFNKSIGINPDFEDAYINRGIAYALSGQDDRAFEDFNKVILLNQESAEAYFNRGSLYLRKGSNALAVSDFGRACDLGKEEACARSSLYGGAQ